MSKLEQARLLIIQCQQMESRINNIIGLFKTESAKNSPSKAVINHCFLKLVNLRDELISYHRKALELIQITPKKEEAKEEQMKLLALNKMFMDMEETEINMVAMLQPPEGSQLHQQSTADHEKSSANYIEGQPIVVRTDHKPLVGALRKSSDTFSPLQRRHLNFISQYIQDLQYLKGQENTVADACSRIYPSEAHDHQLEDDINGFEVELVDPHVSQVANDRYCAAVNEQRVGLPMPELFVEEQLKDTQLQSWIVDQRQKKTNFVPELVRCADVEDILVWADKSRVPARILVPSSMKNNVFQHVHGVSHMGPKGTYNYLKKYYYWPNLKTEVFDRCKKCVSCQRNKVGRHTRSPLKNLPKPTKRFSHIHVDIVGPINPANEGKNTLFTIIDRWSGWPEAIPMSSRGDAASAKTCAKHLLNHWISRFGVPNVITSDRGTQFTSTIWKELGVLLGIKLIQTTSYHPQHNGKVERMHRSLKNALRSRLDGKQDWLKQLPFVLLGLRSMPNTDTEVSSATLVYGQNLDLPGLMVLPKEDIGDFTAFGSQLARAMSQQNYKGPHWHGGETRRVYIPNDLQTCRQVLIRIDAVQPSLKPKYQGPFQVLSRSEKTFEVKLPTGPDVISIDRLIPFRE